MKKFKMLIFLISFISLPFLVDGGGVCTVSSNNDLNTGHCRKNPNGGGDYCFSSGSGAKCSGSYQPVVKKPKQIG